MPVAPKNQDKLGSFRALGVHFTRQEGDNHIGDCPLCGKENKFNVHSESTKWQCWSCQAGGNSTSFVEQLWERLDAETTEYKSIADSRNLYFPETAITWGLVYSHSLQCWLVPGYNILGEVKQLYRYQKVNKRMLLLPTPTLGHQLFGVNLYDKRKPIVDLCEGPWDAMVLWELLAHGKMVEVNGKSTIQQTASTTHSLASDRNVLAAPGCKVFKPEWCSLFAGKVVNLYYDNDHPITQKDGTQRIVGGYAGLQRVAEMLQQSSDPPKEINYKRWGSKGYTPTLPNGTDVRDLLTGAV